MSEDLTVGQAVAELEAMGDDREADHRRADEIVLSFLPSRVRAAYIDVQLRTGGWERVT